MSAPGSQMKSGAATFNLLDEPWVPVLGIDGVEREVSLREAILSAHEFRDVTGELPTMRFALLRILLSITYRVLDRDPVEEPLEIWEKLWLQHEFSDEAFEHYFDEWRHRFDLLDPTQPFLQTPDLHTAKDEWRPVSLIVADTDPDGALFTMRSELDSLTLPEAARWLVHAHAYDYSGIKSGAVGDARVKGGKGYPMGVGWAGWLGGTAVCGNNLRETILLNLIIGRTVRNPGDSPIWERPVLTASQRSPEEIGEIGPLSLMTWPQRRIRLRPENGRITGVVVSNGDALDYTLRHGDEPMTSWRYSEPQTAKAKSLRYMPRKLELGQTLWQGLATLIPTGDSALPSAAAQKKWNLARSAEPAEVIEWVGELVQQQALPADHLIEVSVVSMHYGTQNASFDEVVSDRLSFVAVLAEVHAGEHLLKLAQSASIRAQDAVRTLEHLARDLDRAAGGDGDGVGELVGKDAFAALDLKFREWLLKVMPGCDIAELLCEWTEQVRHIVRERSRRLVERAPTSAWIGRANGENIASVATAMRWFESRIFHVLGASPKRAEAEVTQGGQQHGNTVRSEMAE